MLSVTFGKDARLTATIFWLMGLCRLSAVPIVDQRNDPAVAATGGLWPEPGLAFQQSITAGVTGKLVGIELQIQGGSIFPSTTTGAVNIGVSLGAPWLNGPLTHSVSVPVNSFGWNYYDLSPGGIFLTAGQQFTVHLLPEGWGSANPRLGTGTYYTYQDFGVNFYLGGMLYVNGSTNTFDDLRFRTWMDTSATIPDTGPTLAFFSVSLFLLALLRRVIR
jgi:hypothetical protein